MGTTKLLAILAISLGCACSTHETPPPSAPEGEPVSVRVETLAAVEQPEVYEAIGTVRTRNSAEISSRIPSVIVRIHADAGDRVRAGQLLVELDDRDLASHLAGAQAGLVEVGEAIAEAAQELLAAQAQLELAQITHKRFEDLLQKKSVSRHEYDEAVARLRSAEAAVEMAQARRRQAEAKRSQVESQISSAEVSRGYSRIEAPFGGVVIERRMDPGTLATPGAAILVIDQAGGYRLDASVPEARLSSLRPNDPVTVRLESVGEELQARITEIVPAVDPGSRTATVRIALPNHPSLRSGTFARALLTLESKAVLAVPQEAVIRQGQLDSVFVVVEGVARRRMVSLGALAGERYEVLSGLHEGETIVLDPASVSDGRAVREGARS